MREDKITALMLAAHNGFADIVRLLAPKESGIIGKRGFNALMAAALKGSTECCEILIEKEKGQ